MERRHFLGGLGTALTAAWTERIRSAPAKSDVVIGHGAHRYKVNKDWVAPGQARHHPILNCHEMVRARDGRLFMVGDHWQHQMLVFNQDGRILESWGGAWPGGHGLTLVEENGEEFLFITDSGLWKVGAGSYRQTGRVTKTTLDGREIFSLSHPMSVGAYEPEWPFNPTEVAVAPNGDIYVADGYGSNYVLRYDRNGKFLGRFGGKDQGPADQRINNGHGVAIDLRRGADQAAVIVTSRADNCFRRFSLDGKFIGTIPVPGAYVCRPVIAGDHLYAGVCWSKEATTGKFLKDASGFVVVLDAADRVVAAPGGSEPKYADGKLGPLHRADDVFDHGHDVCVLENGDLVVCQWNASQTYPVKLERIPS